MLVWVTQLAVVPILCSALNYDYPIVSIFSVVLPTA
jgi:hypothetical protein